MLADLYPPLWFSLEQMDFMIKTHILTHLRPKVAQIYNKITGTWKQPFRPDSAIYSNPFVASI